MCTSGQNTSQTIVWTICVCVYERKSNAIFLDCNEAVNGFQLILPHFMNLFIS